jgi:hypothetical protein
MWSAEKTDPLSLVHPRSANVAVLSSGQGVVVTEITSGTLHIRFDTSENHQPFASLSLSVDGSFVTLTVPRVLGTDYLREALDAALPEGYLGLAHPSDEALIVTIARACEVEPTPHLFCTSYDTTMRARKVGINRLLLKRRAREGRHSGADQRARVQAAADAWRDSDGAGRAHARAAQGNAHHVAERARHDGR